MIFPSLPPPLLIPQILGVNIINTETIVFLSVYIPLHEVRII